MSPHADALDVGPLAVLTPEELSQIHGGTNTSSPAGAGPETCLCLDYSYLGIQFKSILHQTLGGAVAGLAVGRSWRKAGEGALAGAMSGATVTLLNQDFRRWVKPGPGGTKRIFATEAITLP